MKLRQILRIMLEPDPVLGGAFHIALIFLLFELVFVLFFVPADVEAARMLCISTIFLALLSGHYQGIFRGKVTGR